MTLSCPSFLAASTSASIPPRSAALAAVAALLEADALFFSGGEQAAIAAIVVAASVTATERLNVRTVFPLCAHRVAGARRVIMRGLGEHPETIKRPAEDQNLKLPTGRRSSS